MARTQSPPVDAHHTRDRAMAIRHAGPGFSLAHGIHAKNSDDDAEIEGILEN